MGTVRCREKTITPNKDEAPLDREGYKGGGPRVGEDVGGPFGGEGPR